MPLIGRLLRGATLIGRLLRGATKAPPPKDRTPQHEVKLEISVKTGLAAGTRAAIMIGRLFWLA